MQKKETAAKAKKNETKKVAAKKAEATKSETKKATATKKEQKPTVQNIPLSEISPSQLNPRKTFDEESLNELAANIKENGLIQPITVRKAPKGAEYKYEIVCGERRYRASKIAGLETIQAVIKELDDKQAFAAMIVENLQRKDVDPMEEAAAFVKCYYEFGMKVAEIGKQVGKSGQFVEGRMALHNTIPAFVELMRNGVLTISHLQRVCRLPKEQQQVLFDECFNEAALARRNGKYIRIDEMTELIDQYVMKFLDTAMFSTTDDTFSCGKSCEGCPFNTKCAPDGYKDLVRPRCMDAACFKQKTLEHIIRTAKTLDIPVVYQGESDNAYVKAAVEAGLTLVDMTGRSYVICPKEPDKEAIADESVYMKRMEAYRHVKAIFDSNVADGNVEEVYEICYHGNLSGEFKYAYTMPADATNKGAVATSDMTKEQVTRLKDKMLKTKESEKEELVEKKRELLATSSYSSLNTALSGEEQRIFHACLIKRLSPEFKKSIGLEWKNSEEWFAESAKIIEENRNAIKREFIKSMLGEKSVCFSHDLQGLLNAIVEEEFTPSAKEIEEEVSKKYENQRTKIQQDIDKLNGKTTEEPAPESEQPAEEAPADQPEGEFAEAEEVTE